MPSVGLQFGDYAFSGTAALLSSWDVRSDNRIKSQIIPLKDGVHMEEALLNPIMVSLKGTLVGGTQTELRTLKDNFLNAICAGTQYLYLWDDRYVVAQKKSLRYDYKASLTFMPFDVTFIGHTPFWIAVTGTSHEKEITSSPTEFEISPAGSAYAKPKITIAAAEAISSLSFENKTTNKKFSYIGAIGSTGSLEIDCGLFTVEKDDVDDIGNFSGDFLSIVNGTNALEYTGGDCTITIEWNDRYY